jgi:serine/threonine protein kinase
VQRLLTGAQVSERYVIRETLGSGGMATVHRAFDPRLNIDVALKVLPSQLARDPTFVARFRREGQTLANLSHPNIVRLFEIGEDEREDLYFLVLEYLSGGTLKAQIDGTPWSVQRVITTLGPVAQAIDYAHQRPTAVIHRDLKPANILFTDDGRPVVSDFGLVKMMAAQTEGPDVPFMSLTAGHVIGTPAYMAPEQAEGHTILPAVDLYALGVIAYELLVGGVPFYDETPLRTLLQVISAPLPRPRDRNPALSPAVEEVLLKALSREPEKRHTTAGAFIDSLAECARAPVRPIQSASPSVTMPALTAPRQTMSGRVIRSRVRSVPGLVALSLAAAISIGATAYVLQGHLASPEQPSATAGTVDERRLPLSTPAVDRSPTQILVSDPAVIAPTVTAQPTRVVTALPTAAPSAEEVWAATLPHLDATWDRDWVQTIDTVSAVVKKFPDYAPASDKLRAALTLYAESLLKSGDAAGAVDQLTRAAAADPTASTSNRSTPPDRVWAVAQPVLDSVWGQDWPRTLAFLEAFRNAYPDYDPAMDKQYEAMVANAQILLGDQQLAQAADMLSRAEVIRPDRPEAPDVAAVLTPTAAPAPARAPVVSPSRAAPAPAPAPAPPPARVAPAPVAPPPAAPAPPVDTAPASKSQFVPPPR